MKKIRFLLVGLFVLGLFFINNTYALKFSDLLGYSSLTDTTLSKNSIGIKQSLCYFDSSTVGGSVLSTVPITRKKMASLYSANSVVYYRAVGVRWSVANGNINFELYDYDNNQRNSVIYPVSGVNYRFNTDGQTVLLDNVYFYYNTIILFDDAHTHSLQIIKDNSIEDMIVFVDFLQDTYNNSGDNLYLIDFHLNKAWSIFLSNTGVINDLFYGRLENYAPDYFYNLPYDKSYTLYEVSSSPWIPSNSNIRSKLSTDCYSFNKQNDTGFTYSLDTNFIAPNFGNGGGNSGSSGSYVDSDLTDWNNYQSCIRDYSFRNFIIDNKTACNEDFQNGLIDFTGRNTVFDYVFNYADIWTANSGDYEEIFNGIDLENANGCYGLVKNAESLVALYRSEDKAYSDYQAVISQVKYLSRGSKYDYEAMCGKEPAVPTQYRPITNSSPVCNFDSWSNFANCFAYGGSSVNSSGSSYFSLTFENAKSMISLPFHEKFIDPLKSHYDSGFAVVDVANSFICDANTVSPLPQGIGDLILVFVLSILAFILFF